MSGSTAVVRSGADMVDRSTGEVVETREFNMNAYLSGITSAASFDHQQKLAAAYDATVKSLIGPNDVQQEGNRTFKKKSAWMKLARHFGISTRVVSTKESIAVNGVDFLAVVTVEAVAPWGQSAEAVGACCQDEATGRRVITVADAIATAQTRATNRAVSNLIAMGEVSAEEMSKGNGNGRAAAPSNVPPAEFLLPFGRSKGTKLGEMDRKDLQGAYDWACDKGKFEEFQKAGKAVLSGESSLEQFSEDSSGFPPALEDADDDLPF